MRYICAFLFFVLAQSPAVIGQQKQTTDQALHQNIVRVLEDRIRILVRCEPYLTDPKAHVSQLMLVATVQHVSLAELNTSPNRLKKLQRRCSGIQADLYLWLSRQTRKPQLKSMYLELFAGAVKDAGGKLDRHGATPHEIQLIKAEARKSSRKETP